MKTFVSTALFALLLAFAAQAQTPDPFPQFPLPSGIVATVNFDQLGDPQFTGSIGGIYPIVGSAGVYGISGAEFFPRTLKDPKTGKPFIGLTTNLQQEVHKSILTVGRWTFLLGLQAGPSFSTSPSEGFAVAFAGGGSGSIVCQLNKTFSLLLSPKLMYMSDVAVWRVIPRFGLKINLPSKK